jgi:hypothetical protein
MGCAGAAYEPPRRSFIAVLWWRAWWRAWWFVAMSAPALAVPVPADEPELMAPVESVWAAAAPAASMATATPVTRIFAFISKTLPRLFERDCVASKRVNGGRLGSLRAGEGYRRQMKSALFLANFGA